jgi:nucleotide-binding universal stress UspA family protein
MTKVLLAISDRWLPDLRVENLGDFVQRLGGSILAVHIAYGSEASGAEVQPGEKILDQIAKRLRAKNAKVDTLFLFSDDIGAAILKTAEEHQATMIVLGLSSKGMLTRLIEGNVAQEVIRGAKMPVLLLPADWMNPI